MLSNMKINLILVCLLSLYYFPLYSSDSLISSGALAVQSNTLVHLAIDKDLENPFSWYRVQPWFIQLKAGVIFNTPFKEYDDTYRYRQTKTDPGYDINVQMCYGIDHGVWKYVGLDWGYTTYTNQCYNHTLEDIPGVPYGMKSVVHVYPIEVRQFSLGLVLLFELPVNHKWGFAYAPGLQFASANYKYLTKPQWNYRNRNTQVRFDMGVFHNWGAFRLGYGVNIRLQVSNSEEGVYGEYLRFQLAPYLSTGFRFGKIRTGRTVYSSNGR